MASLKDIAQELKLSISVVSRVLNPNPDANARVSDQTRALVQETAARMGYRRNHAAEFMRRKRSAAIGVFIPDISNRLSADLLFGLHEAANTAGFAISLHVGLTKESYHKFIEDHCRQASSGIISYSPLQYHFPEQEALLHAYREAGGKVLILNNPSEKELYNVSMDEFAGGVLAADALLQHTDCRQLLVCATHSAETASILTMRGDGFRHRAQQCGIPVEEVYRHADALARITARPGEKYGVFADTDYQAWELMKAARQLDLIAGRDFYLVGYDDLEFSQFMDPPLTTVRQDFRVLGQLAVRTLLQLIYQQPTRQATSLPPVLQPRKTA